jgi:hypothetical protein
MKLILLIAALYAALVAVNHLTPGPGEADVRGEARIVRDAIAEARADSASPPHNPTL